jgi:hypothetical protein
VLICGSRIDGKPFLAGPEVQTQPLKSSSLETSRLRPCVSGADPIIAGAAMAPVESVGGVQQPCASTGSASLRDGRNGPRLCDPHHGEGQGGDVVAEADPQVSAGWCGTCAATAGWPAATPPEVA